MWVRERRSCKVLCPLILRVARGLEGQCFSLNSWWAIRIWRVCRPLWVEWACGLAPKIPRKSISERIILQWSEELYLVCSSGWRSLLSMDRKLYQIFMNLCDENRGAQGFEFHTLEFSYGLNFSRKLTNGSLLFLFGLAYIGSGFFSQALCT